MHIAKAGHAPAFARSYERLLIKNPQSKQFRTVSVAAQQRKRIDIFPQEVSNCP